MFKTTYYAAVCAVAAWLPASIVNADQIPSSSAGRALPMARSESSARGKVRDVVLTSTGSFQGRFVDQNGTPVEGARVNVLQNGQPIAQTLTDEQGQFSVPNLNQGVYGLRTGDIVQVVRTWTPETAPPQASNSATFVNKGTTVLGQGSTDGFALGTFAVGGLIGAGIGGGTVYALDDNDKKKHTP